MSQGWYELALLFIVVKTSSPLEDEAIYTSNDPQLPTEVFCIAL